MPDDRAREEKDLDAIIAGAIRHEEPVFSDGALEFLRRAADGKHRIVCSCDLTTLQIAEARGCHKFYVEPGGGLGWALLPWERSTVKDSTR